MKAMNQELRNGRATVAQRVLTVNVNECIDSWKLSGRDRWVQSELRAAHTCGDVSR